MSARQLHAQLTFGSGWRSIRSRVRNMQGIRCERCEELLRAYREGMVKFRAASERLMSVEDDLYQRTLQDALALSEECARLRDLFLFHVQTHSAPIAAGTIVD